MAMTMTLTMTRTMRMTTSFDDHDNDHDHDHYHDAADAADAAADDDDEDDFYHYVHADPPFLSHCCCDDSNKSEGRIARFTMVFISKNGQIARIHRLSCQDVIAVLGDSIGTCKERILHQQELSEKMDWFQVLPAVRFVQPFKKK